MHKKILAEKDELSKVREVSMTQRWCNRLSHPPHTREAPGSIPGRCIFYFCTFYNKFVCLACRPDLIYCVLNIAVSGTRELAKPKRAAASRARTAATTQRAGSVWFDTSYFLNKPFLQERDAIEQDRRELFSQRAQKGTLDPSARPITPPQIPSPTVRHTSAGSPD